jgi:hypothetical protein
LHLKVHFFCLRPVPARKARSAAQKYISSAYDLFLAERPEMALQETSLDLEISRLGGHVRELLVDSDEHVGFLLRIDCVPENSNNERYWIEMNKLR